MEVETTALSAREKGDIYWRKLKYYLQSVREKGDQSQESRSLQMFAAEILSEDTTELSRRVREGSLAINGNEFKRRPPTATGEDVYKQNILLVKVSAAYFRELADVAKGTEVPKEDRVLVACLEKLIPVMEQALSVWFSAHGVCAKTGEKLSAKDMEAASGRLAEEIKKYETEVGNFKGKVAKSVVKELLESSQEADTDPEGDHPFDALVAAHEDVYQKHRELIERATKEYKLLSAKRRSYRMIFPRLVRLVREKGGYTYANKIMIYKDAALYYRDYIEEQFVASLWAEKGCVSLIRSLLTGEPVDPMVANYIYAHWKTEVPTLPLYEKVKDLPGFKSFSEDLNIDTEKMEFPDLSAIREGIATLEEFKDTHEELFRGQTITSILFDADELPRIGGMAKQLRSRIAHGSKEGEFDGLTKREKIDLGEAWILADSMARTAYILIEYRIRSEKRTLADLVATFRDEFYEMGYYAQERACRASLEAYGIRRRLTD